tara:strand:- start:2112 stop:4931 length:2820 start_codon:yes stop_codon:yes gene_type:complete
MPRKKAASLDHRSGHPPMIRTKLEPPRGARRMVPRERALKLLSLGSERLLTLLRAPAGFGKTTVLADWRGQLLAASRPVAWVTLDEDDNDASSFVSYVIRALGEALGSLADHVPELSANPESATPKVTLTSAINALDSIDATLTLVLDDYDRVTASGIHDLMSFLLLHAPGNLRIVIAARAEPPLPLAYLRAHDDLVEINDAHLRFNLEDARRFFGEVGALKLDAGQSRALHEATEGWVAGMQLAAISLRDRADTHRVIDALPGRFVAINDYLSEVVLPNLNAPTVDFLLHSSILERMNGPLCAAVTGRADAAEQLGDLHQRNYFLQSLDAEQSWFRFHALFRDFLRTELARRFPEAVSGLHTRAANWFAEHRLWAEAVRHALAADRIDLAAEWVEHCAMREVEDSRVHVLLSWARKIPDSAIRSRPRLQLAVAWALLLTIELDAAMEHVEDMEARLTKSEFKNSTAVESELLALRFCITALKDDTAAALPFGEAFAKRLRGGKNFEEPVVWAVQATLNGLTHCYQKAGRLEEARAMQSPELYPVSNDSDRNLFTQCYRATTLGGCDIRAAHLHEGARRLRESLALAELHAGRRSAAATLVACSLAAIHYEWNELDIVDQLLADRLDIVDEACYLDSVRSAYLALTRLAIVRGDFEAAHQLLDRGELLANRRGWSRLTAVCLAERVRLHLVQAHPLDAGAACQRLSELAPRNAPASASAISETWRVFCLSQARVLLHAGQASQASKMLNELLRIDQSATGTDGSAYLVARTKALLCVTLQASGEPQAALEQLEDLMELGAASGMIRSIADEGASIAVLVKHHGLQWKPTTPSAERWKSSLDDALGIRQGASTQAAKRESAEGLIEPLSKRERDVLTLIARGLSNEQAARALNIGSETVKWHLKNVYSKLGVSRRTLAVHRARQMDLISDEPAAKPMIQS